MEAVVQSETREKMRTSICQLLHTGYDLEFLHLKSDAQILNHGRSKRKKIEGTLEGQKQEFSCSRAPTGWLGFWL